MQTNINGSMRRLILTTLALSAACSDNSRAGEVMASQADLIQRVVPGVVTIFVRKTPASDPRTGAAAADVVLDYAHGAGFVIDPDGLIVTNRHNVVDARQLIIGFSDGSYALGSVVAATTKIDLALLRVKVDHKLAALSFADSDNVRVGDAVLAIGNPLGVGTSVSAGIVSALNRDIKDSVYDDFIQTDAAINHGNSGGPLIDQSGQVIGMNSDIFSASGGSMGIGFALTSNVTKFLVDRLRQYGRIKSSWIGLELQDVTPGIAVSLREPSSQGVVITEVTQGSPAMAAGLAEGDIVQSIDRSTVLDARDAARRLAVLSGGDTAHLAVWHDGHATAVDVRAVEVPVAEEVDNPAPLLNQFTTSGLELSALTDEVRASVNMAPSQPGVLVSAVPSDAFTGLSFLLPGDVLLRVQQNAVASPDDVQHFIAQAKDEGLPGVVLLVQRKNGRSWIPLLIADLKTISQ